MAEREGFEPSNPLWGLRDFESRAFDHSAISPWLVYQTILSITVHVLMRKALMTLKPTSREPCMSCCMEMSLERKRSEIDEKYLEGLLIFFFHKTEYLFSASERAKVGFHMKK